MAASTTALSCVNNFSQGVTYDGYVIECGVDYFGNDLAHVAASSFTDCISSCDATLGCVDVSYVPDTQTCWMKNAASGRRNDDFVWTARKPDQGTGAADLSCVNGASNGQTYNGFQISCGVDYYGGDMNYLVAPSFTACIDACASTNGCVDVSYNGQNCYLKALIGQPSTDAAVWTATKSSTSPNDPTCVGGASNGQTYTTSKGTYQILCDKDYYGGDLINQDTASFAQCIAACDSTAGCIDVSYVGHACYMKSALNTLNSAQGVWTAVLTSTTAQSPSTGSTSSTLTCVGKASDGTTFTTKEGGQYQIACGVDYQGGDLTLDHTDTFEGCIESCDTTVGCVDVSYRGTTCYLKQTLTAAVADDNVWAAKFVGRVSTTTSSTTTTTTSSSTTTTTPATTFATSTTTSSSAVVTTSAASDPTFRMVVLYGSSIQGFLYASNGAAYVASRASQATLFTQTDTQILSGASNYLGYPTHPGSVHPLALYSPLPYYNSWIPGDVTGTLALANTQGLCAIDDGTIYVLTDGPASFDCSTVRLAIEGAYTPPPPDNDDK